MSLEENQLPLTPTAPEQPYKLSQPPNLRTICSISCSLPAPQFFGLLIENKVDAVLDARITRNFRGEGFSTREADFCWCVEASAMYYIVADQLAPTIHLREEFARRSDAKDPSAWTWYLEQYEALLRERRPLRTDPLKSVIYGVYSSIAIVCSCQHHDDCHRSYACGMLTNYLTGVELKILYPGDKEPSRKSPRRYRQHNFSHANLQANGRGKR